MFLIAASFEAANLDCVLAAAQQALTDGQSSPSRVDRKLMMVGFLLLGVSTRGVEERMRAA
jgi:hypothetical protein